MAWLVKDNKMRQNWSEILISYIHKRFFWFAFAPKPIFGSFSFHIDICCVVWSPNFTFYSLFCNLKEMGMSYVTKSRVTMLKRKLLLNTEIKCLVVKMDSEDG